MKINCPGPLFAKAGNRRPAETHPASQLPLLVRIGETQGDFTLVNARSVSNNAACTLVRKHGSA